MRKILSLSAVATLTLLAATPANSTVLYELVSNFTQATFTTDDFLSASGNIPSEDFISCIIGGITCTAISYDDSLSRSNFLRVVGDAGNPSSAQNFFFENGAFSSPGTYSVGFATLTVSQVSGVPEPATWAMMLLGFGSMGVAMRRGKNRALRLSGVA